MLALVLAAVTTATAADDPVPVAWRTFSQPTRWHSKVDLILPKPLRVHGTEEFAQLPRVEVHLELSCAPGQASRKLEVRCTVDDAAFFGKAGIGEEGELVGAMYQFEQALEHDGVVIDLRFHKTGRLVDVDLDGLPVSSRQDNENADLIAELTRRALLGLDLPLDPQGESPVKQKQAMLLIYPQTLAPASAKLVHDVGPTDDGFTVRTQGSGMTTSDASTYAMTVESQAELDASGALLARVWLARGRVADSGTTRTNMMEFVQQGAIRRLAQGEEVPPFPPSGEM